MHDAWWWFCTRMCIDAWTMKCLVANALPYFTSILNNIFVYKNLTPTQSTGVVLPALYPFSKIVQNPSWHPSKTKYTMCRHQTQFSLMLMIASIYVHCRVIFQNVVATGANFSPSAQQKLVDKHVNCKFSGYFLRRKLFAVRYVTILPLLILCVSIVKTCRKKI